MRQFAISLAFLAIATVLFLKGLQGNEPPGSELNARSGIQNSDEPPQPLVPIPSERMAVTTASKDTSANENASGPQPPEQADLIPLVNNHPQIVINMKARQGALRQMLPYIRLEQTEPLDTAHVARNASQLAVLTILDATGRSELVDSESRALLPMSDDLTHSISSGNALYQFSWGEFPTFDRVTTLAREFPDGIPLGELPLPEVEALVTSALSYSPE